MVYKRNDYSASEESQMVNNKIIMIGISIMILVGGLGGCTTNEQQQSNANNNQPENGNVNQHQENESANQSQGFLLNWTREPGVRIQRGVSSATILINNTYVMYYTAQDICMATSSDGLNFTLKGTVVNHGEPGSGQDMASNSAIISLRNGSYRMIYEGSRWTDYYDQKSQQMRHNQIDRKFYSAFSTDGFSWRKEEGVRFQDHPIDDPTNIFTSVPDIIRLENGDLRMYYTTGDSSAIALSHDEGMTWTKEKNLDLGRIIVDCDIVRLTDGTYKLFFTSFDSQFGVGKQYVMSATSPDGLNFTLDSGKRLEPSSESNRIYDPDVILLSDGTYRMYYSQVVQSDGMTSIFSAIIT